MLRIAIAFGLLVMAPLAQAAENYPQGQLPTDVAPTHYTLDLTVVPNQPTFSGRAVIDVKIEKPTNVIWLHGRDLKVSAVKFTDAKGGVIAATWTEIPDSYGTVKLALAKQAVGPTAKIDVTYTAEFNKRLEGLYRADEAGESYAYTQMEPYDARRAFPSFDEPRFKTPYDVTLTVKKTHAAISNGPAIKEQAVGSDMKKITYGTTKPLPTYLIAFAVGPFDVVEWQPVPKTAIRDRVVPLRGITVKGKGEQIKYALGHTAGLLTTLENYFGIPYPFEKLDIIAALDFAAGAMENAGAIVYREQLMLMDETSPLATKRRYAIVHAHELAHQWFGDLVTPAWWNDIWLNEAFATWMEHKATDTWDPKGEYGRDGLGESLAAMSVDSKRAARRIAQPIEAMDDIENAFDSITYDKGNGVLAMFEHYYGVENFRKGIQLYFERHKWGTATSADFMQAIADANKDTKGVAAFQTFLNQAGVPMVDAELTCGPNGATVDIKQSRYYQAGSGSEGAAERHMWKIPMCIAHGDAKGRQETCTLVETQTAKIPLKGGACPAWFMPNSDGAGYMRFGLRKKGWDSLLASVNSINDREALATLDSLEAAFDAGEMDVSDYLTRLKALMGRNGGNMTWDLAGAAQGQLIWVKDTLATGKAQPAAEKYIVDLYGPLYAKLGLDPTSELDKTNPTQAGLMRPTVVTMVAVHGKLPAARNELAKRGARYLGLTADAKPGDGKIHPEVVDANLLDVAVVVAVQDLGKPVVDAIFAHLKTEREANVRQRILGALTRSTDPAIATRVRALALTEELRVNETPMLISGATRERANVAAGWEWFKTNFETIKEKTRPGARGGLVNIGGRFCTAAEREDFQKFFEARIESLEGGPRNFAATLETIDNCVLLSQKQRGKTEMFFAKN